MKNSFDLENKIAIVTGGGSGLGKSVAKALAQAGADVIIVDTNTINAKEVSDEIQELGKQSLCIKADVTNKKDLQNMVETVIKYFKKIDILVHSAGIGLESSLLLELKEEDWDRVIDINLKGTFLSNQIIAMQMAKQRNGRIINIASMSGYIVNRSISDSYGGFGVYCASKAGVILLTKSFAMELIKYNINVNSISPGYMETPLTIENWKNNPDVFNDLKDMTPIKRPGLPEEINGLVVYLASDSSSYMTGSDIIIDGGYTCW